MDRVARIISTLANSKQLVPIGAWFFRNWMLAKLILDKLNAGVVSCYTKKRWTRSYCLELWINFTTMIFRIVIGNISKHFTFLIDGYTFLNGTLRFFFFWSISIIAKIDFQILTFMFWCELFVPQSEAI